MAPPAPPPPDEANFNGDNQSGSATMTNGPSAAPGEAGNQLWERAWTVDEMRKGAGNWSLAGDAGLLLMLQEFSQRMISRTHEIEKSMEGLVHQAKISGVKLDNVFNDFIMLANTQFVENRVYDEDVGQDTTTEPEKKTEEQEKSREHREAELIPKISEALNFGIKVIDDAFETLDVNAANSDSEDEDIPQRADPILEPKDPYVIRPLPHIIGSPMFMQEDDVGLVEPPSDAETESHGSISESEAEEEADQSEESSEGEYSESESSSEDEPKKRPEPRRTIHSTSSEGSGSEGDLFGGKDSEAENDIDSDDDISKQKKQPIDFTSELASKIGVPPKQPRAQESDEDKFSEEEAEQKHKVKKERSESSAGKSKKKHHEHKHRERSKSKIKSAQKTSSHAEDDDPFGTSTRADEEDDSPFGKKGLFSGSKGLFDDEGDEGGLFDDIEKPVGKPPEKAEIITEEADEEPPKLESRPRTRSGKKVPAGGISIFGGGDDDLFTESTRESPPEEKSSAPVQAKPVSSGGLFDDDAEDDLFAAVPTKAAAKSDKPKSSASRPVDSLFGEGEDDLFGDTASSTVETTQETKPKPKKKLPAGAVSMFGNAPNPLAAALKQKLGVENSDEEDDKGSSDEAKSRSGSVKSSNSVVSSSGSLNKAVSAVKKGDKPSPSGSSNSLFADEPEDDLFSTKPPPVKSTSKASHKKTSLFADDEDDAEDDLFGLPKETPKPTSNREKSDSLFGEKAAPVEDDLFGGVAGKPRADSARKKPVGGVALFGGADLFGKKTTPTTDENKAEPPPVADKKHEVTKPVPRKNTLSLFDDEDEDLFGAGKAAAKSDTSSKKPAVKPRSKSKSLFADEDVLFGGPSEDVPSVDLFGESPQTTPQKTAPKPKQPEKRQEPSGGSVTVKGATALSSSTDLFGGIEDEEEDLFGGKSKEDTKPKAVPKVEEGKILLDDATTTETSDAPPEKPEEPRKPKKPAGAVSMFGGIDPFAAMKKKQPAEPQLVKDPLFEDSEEGSLFSKPVKKESNETVSEPAVAPKPVASKPKKPVGGVSMFGGFDPLGGSKPVAESTTDHQEENSQEGALPSSPPEKDGDRAQTMSTSPPSPSKAIGKLKANLMINPAALLPGAAPPVKEAEPVAVGFDQPAEASTLHSASKDRAKILTRRRPQSRKARKVAASADSTETDDLLASPASPPLTSPSITQSPRLTESPAKPSSDLFGNDDILGGAVKTSSHTDSILSIGQEKYEDDIFSKEFTKTTVKQSSVAIKEEVEDDLFGSSTVSASKKVTTTTTTSKVSRSIVTETEQDDLFSGLKTKSGANTSRAVTEEETNSEKKSEILDTAPPNEPAEEEKSGEKNKAKLPDDDDIFADSSILKKKEPTPPPVDDDIFSDSILNKPPAKSAETLDDDDIFAASAPKKDKKKKQVTKDEDLFKDDTDIFADLPASKPKEKKKKKTSSSKKSVFKDDVDDIFADSSLQAKPKKDSGDKKKKSASKKKEVEDIFDDPLNAAGP